MGAGLDFSDFLLMLPLLTTDTDVDAASKFQWSSDACQRFSL